MNITVLDSGFVTGDFLSPVAFAGEVNSRILNIVHPNYENCHYQLIVIKNNHAYKLGIDNGKVLLPPSLMSDACKLDCCFVAFRAKSNNDDVCNCLPSYSNDCSDMLMKSDKFTLIVGEGLNINGLSPIPPYEELIDAYNNLAIAKSSIEQAKLENQKIANTIDERIDILQSTKVNDHSTFINGKIALNDEVNDMINEIF